MTNDINKTPLIFIVIAAYNEEHMIKTVTDQLLELYDHIVVVDDGSIDGTSAVLENSNVKLLRHLINRGQGAALQTGIRYALLNGADIIVTFDADGQHDVKDIDLLLKPIIIGECDITLGSRFIGQTYNIPFIRKLTLKAGVLFTRLVSGVRLTDVHNGLRAFSTEFGESLHITMDRMGHASEILDQVKMSGLRYIEVPVNIYYSQYSLSKGQSSWNAIKLAMQIIIEKITK